MTIKELIEHLQTFPQDAESVCLYRAYSDYSILDADQITYHPVGGTSMAREDQRYVKRNGQIMLYNPRTWDKAEVPVFVAIVAFPGN